MKTENRKQQKISGLTARPTLEKKTPKKQFACGYSSSTSAHQPISPEPLFDEYTTPGEVARKKMSSSYFFPFYAKKEKRNKDKQAKQA